MSNGDGFGTQITVRQGDGKGGVHVTTVTDPFWGLDCEEMLSLFKRALGGMGFHSDTINETIDGGRDERDA